MTFDGCERYGCLYELNVKPLEMANQALAKERDELRRLLEDKRRENEYLWKRLENSGSRREERVS